MNSQIVILLTAYLAQFVFWVDYAHSPETDSLAGLVLGAALNALPGSVVLLIAMRLIPNGTRHALIIRLAMLAFVLLVLIVSRVF